VNFNDMAIRAKGGLIRERGKLWQQITAVVFINGAAIFADCEDRSCRAAARFLMSHPGCFALFIL